MFYILFQDFLGDLKTQRTRAFLTFFAVTWGTLAVVLLLAFGEGLKRTVRDGLLGAGERMFMVYGGETSNSVDRPAHCSIQQILIRFVDFLSHQLRERGKWWSYGIKNRMHDGSSPCFRTSGNDQQ